MRLEITRRADLATRALIALARSGERMKASQLAELLGTTPGFVPQVLHPLVTHGWVGSEPGPAGGYSATTTLDRVSVLDVIEAVEGPTVTGRCVLADRPCGESGTCALHEPWARARNELLEQLGGTSLAELDVTPTHAGRSDPPVVR